MNKIREMLADANHAWEKRTEAVSYSNPYPDE